MDKSNFLNSIKITQNKEKDKLIAIKKRIQKDINRDNILNLTKDLSDKQKQELKQLYYEEIKKLNYNMEQYKNKITKIRLVKNG